MSAPDRSRDSLLSLEATLRFAHASGVWIVAGAEEAEISEEARGGDRKGVVAGYSTDDPGSGRLAPDEGQGGSAVGTEALRVVRSDLGDCQRCRLSQGRTHIVFGAGNPAARLMFVGEAPGSEEDRRGEPFVGRAGELLDRMIRALGLQRQDVYIANVLKCRPPGNRDPASDEAATCIPFLWRQIDAIRPAVICALGLHAAKNLLGEDSATGSVRGRPQRTRGWSVLPVYHPAYLLRTPSAKRLAWRDLKVLKRLLAQGD